jgi:uncharacterized 2Fe-2S/4Fe-4S cluster protein (DUF4445 family)
LYCFHDLHVVPFARFSVKFFRQLPCGVALNVPRHLQKTKGVLLPVKSPALTIAVPVQASVPSLQDNTADLDRLKGALGQVLPGDLKTRNLEIPFVCMASVAAAFRGAGFSGCAILNVLPWGLELVDFLADLPDRLPALALDLGTTHLEASLVDLLGGDVLARGHGVNRQIEYGADILSRIHYARTKNELSDGQGLQELQGAVCSAINDLAAELAAQASLRVEDVRAAAVSGNTTMVHLLLGLNPYHICREPYIPLVNAPDPFPAREIGLALHDQAPVWILPSIGSYFGGDLVSGILASRLDQAEETSMLIDVGTNAEVVLGNRDWLIACAGAAGPALEGGVARMGMRADSGAIEHVTIDRDRWRLAWNTIDNAPPVGICGSGLIDLVAELYLARIVDLRGKFQGEFPGQTAQQREFVRSRLQERDGEQVFIVAFENETGRSEPVVLSQVDLDAMMRSKAAMYAILTTLTSQVGVAFEDLAEIYVAGAFGKHIDPRRAITLGMLPDLPLSTFTGIGNSSLHGAELILLDEQARIRASEVGRKITYIELNVNQEFMIRFSGSRFIPHTDPERFPSVPTFNS